LTVTFSSNPETNVGGGVKMLLARRFENVAPCRAADAKTATGF
jgi:hypothetical protein